MKTPENRTSGNGGNNLNTRMTGFTMVELVIVIMLLGVLSVTAMSRFVGSDAFATSTVAQQIIAQARYAQQTASSRQDAQISLIVDQIADDWRFRVVSSVDGVLKTEQVERANTSMQAVNGVLIRPIDATQAMQLSFDAFGDLAGLTLGVTAGVPAEGVWVQVDGDSPLSVCVYPNGYAANGSCV